MIRNLTVYILGVFVFLLLPAGSTHAITSCGNGIDDDGDTLIDYPSDPGCAAVGDADETDGVLPGTVTNPVADPSVCGSAKINLSWDATTDVGQYVVTDYTHAIEYGTVGPTMRTYTHTGLTPGDFYGYSIRAENAYGSTYSDEAWAQAPTACTGPNLESSWIQHYSGSLRSGEVDTFQAKVHNAGDTAVSSSFTNEFTYQWDTSTGAWQTMSGGTHTHSSLGAHGYDYDLVDFTPDRAGTLYIQYCVDSGLDIDEGTNETPNCLVESFVVTEASCVGTDWRMVGTEGDTIALTGTQLVRYKAEDSWVEGTYSGTIECTTAFFGSDPFPGETKYCYTEGSPIVDYCEQSDTVHGDTNGQCVFGYAGSCESSCNNGTWVPMTNSCTLPIVNDFRICTEDYTTCANDGDTFIVATGTPLKAVWATNDGDVCSAVSGDGFDTTDAPTGEDGITSSDTASTSVTYQVACNYNGGIPDDASINVVTLQELPELSSDATTVREGATVELSWDTNNGDETSCSISGGGVDSAALFGNGSGDGETGSASVTISARTTFMITCGSLTNLKTIEIVPSGWEG